MVKTCTRCNVEQPADTDHFHKSDGGKYGLASVCKTCWKTWRDDHKDSIRSRNRKVAEETKSMVMAHYGGRCACCGEDRLQFLTIDHINGGGTKHRKEIGHGGHAVYRWLIRNDFPPDFQVLCFNCNDGRQVNGGICPHAGGAVRIPANIPQVINGNLFIDDRGSIAFVNDFNMRNIRRIYTVYHEKPGMIRAWHAHNVECKFAFVIDGTFLFGAVNLETEKVDKFVLSDKQPKLLFVPSGYANGFMNLTATGIIQFFSTSTLEESKGDDTRFSWDKWNIWEDNFR